MKSNWMALAALGCFAMLVWAAEDRPKLHPLPPLAGNAKTGPAVGTKIPALQAIDQDGKPRDFQSLRGPKGLVLVFARSADWCPYCKTHLADINKQVQAFKDKGLAVASITYDSQAVLKDFSTRLTIGYPMLSDPQSKVIRAFGLLNTNVDPKSPQYGIPFPGTIIVNEKGVVTSKYFEDDYRERYSAASIVTHEFGADGVDKTMTETTQMKVTSSASDARVAPGNRVTLIVDIEPKPKMHVYAPGVKKYLPIDWQIVESKITSATEVKYPASHMINLPAIGETVPVYDQPTRFTRDVVIGQEDEVGPEIGSKRMLSVYGTLKYQACDDRQCYLPKTVPLKWTVLVERLDPVRPPAAIQRKIQ